MLRGWGTEILGFLKNIQQEAISLEISALKYRNFINAKSPCKLSHGLLTPALVKYMIWNGKE